MTNRQKQALETKKLLEDTGRVMLREGLENFRVEDLTNACGVSKGIFYHYFENKDKFVFHLSMDTYLEMEKRLKKMKKDPVRDQLQYYVVEHTKSMLNGFTKQYYLSILGGDDVLNDGAEKMDYDIRTIEHVLNAAAENGELRDDIPSAQLAKLIFVSLLGRSLYWLIQQDKCDPMQLAQELFETFIMPAVDQYRV